MIDMSLLPEQFRKGWNAICAYAEGGSMLPRFTLEIGDLLRPLAPAYGITSHGPVIEEDLIQIQRAQEDWSRRHTLTVGRDIAIEQLYPQLWNDWRWEDAA